eukprot:GGOE01000064.1.p3 GENE.GGOE01000064.1~~GGOE01000064.1.p3  ORF type:complete len:151 (-),score=10.84 GGOE01000064.1:576-1028(-)
MNFFQPSCPGSAPINNRGKDVDAANVAEQRQAPTLPAATPNSKGEALGDNLHPWEPHHTKVSVCPHRAGITTGSHQAKRSNKRGPVQGVLGHSPHSTTGQRSLGGYQPAVVATVSAAAAATAAIIAAAAEILGSFLDAPLGTRLSVQQRQ